MLALDDCIYRGGRNAKLARDAHVTFAGACSLSNFYDVIDAECARRLARQCWLFTRIEIQSIWRRVVFIVPGFISNDPADVNLRDVVMSSEFTLLSPIRIHFSDIADVFPPEFCAGAVFAFKDTASASAAQHPVSCIVVMIAEDQMIGVNTFRAVAGVANQHAIWDVSLERLETLQVGPKSPPLVGQLPISKSVSSGDPIQTPVRSNFAVVSEDATYPTPLGARAIGFKRRAAERAGAHRKIKLRREHTNVCVVCCEVMQ